MQIKYDVIAFATCPITDNFKIILSTDTGEMKDALISLFSVN